MANEITVTMTLSVLKGGVSENLNFSKQITMAGTNIMHDTVTATTSNVALGLGGITTPGWCLCKNLDATNFVTLTPDASTSSATIKMAAGEAALFRFAGTTPFIKADTASCRVEIFLIEA